jgi:hypothetical protein
MNLEEINQLIAIRQFIAQTVGSNYNVEKAAISDLNGMLILIDQKIVNALLHPEFKSFIGFENVKEAISKLTQMNNIKSGIVGR